jgi:hypothetical protein
VRSFESPPFASAVCANGIPCFKSPNVRSEGYLSLANLVPAIGATLRLAQ